MIGRDEAADFFFRIPMPELKPPNLPPSLAALRPLAYNLRWSWNRRAGRLFERLDRPLWSASRQNPVYLLSHIDPISLEIAARDEAYIVEVQAAAEDLQRYMQREPAPWYEREHGDAAMRVAYFSAEFAVTEAMPIFSGGLGVLAGDHLKSASDLGVPLVAVGLLYREGYFEQRVDRTGQQHEKNEHIDPNLLPLTLERRPDGEPFMVSFPMLDHRGYAQVWRADVGRVPLYLLDTDIPANAPEDRHITDRLYGGDNEHRLRQEIVLGVGGMRALGALGIQPTVVHLNEGHAAFAAVERVRQTEADEPTAFAATAQRLAQGVAFTTHTPVPAGHDMFPTHLMERYLGGYIWEMREPWRRFLSLGRHDPTDDDEPFNMTLLALRLSGRRNGVSRLHGEVSRRMWWGVWPGLAEEDVPIVHITNGVHLPTWVAEPMAKVYTDCVSREWEQATDEVQWQRAAHIPLTTLWNARQEQRRSLIEEARAALKLQTIRRGENAAWTDNALDINALTVVFARRFATYKRATLLLSDPERLKKIIATGNVQFIFAGKAHPRDEPGKELLRQIFAFAGQPDVRERFLFLEEYDIDLARILVAGADVWLNVPRKPYEASGTSGMKAAANGALNLSIPDGWWAEAWTDHNHATHAIGWSIEPVSADMHDPGDADALYTLLENDVVPVFHQRDLHGVPLEWTERVRASIRQIVPYFNTHRMVREYMERCYGPAHESSNGDAVTRRRGDAASS
jgi:starch phosphorylase